MADRQIGSLPELRSVNPGALFLVEQDGEAKRIAAENLNVGGSDTTDDEVLGAMISSGLIAPASDGASIYTDGDGTTILIY